MWLSWHQKVKTNLEFNEARGDAVAVGTAGPYANHLHLAPEITTSAPYHLSFFKCWMLFLTTKQQHQSTEGNFS